jgi:DNA-binding MarR family transcriptional regulator
MSSQKHFIEAMENWANIYLFRSLTEYFDYLKTTDVSMPQAYALTFIHYKGPSKISEIGDHMMVSAAATSQMVDRLEKLDFVERTTYPGDRRVRRVMLTSQGKNFVKQSIKARQSWMKKVPSDLSDEQMDEISGSLQLITSIYQESN